MRRRLLKEEQEEVPFNIAIIKGKGDKITISFLTIPSRENYSNGAFHRINPFPVEYIISFLKLIHCACFSNWDLVYKVYDVAM